MAMRTSVVVADGSFPTVTAPLLGPLEQTARLAARYGYDALSITINRPEEVDPERTLALLRPLGLSVSGLATGRIYTVDGLSLGSKDEENRRAAVERMLRHARLCARLDAARLIVGAVRGRTRDAGGRQLYVEQFTRSMETLVNEGEKLGIQILLEAISVLDSDAYCTIDETAAFVRSFASPALRLQLDSIHMHTNREDFYPAVLRAGDLISQVDISDVDRMAPDGNHFDFPLLFRALEATGYQDYLVFEFRAQPPAQAAKAGLDYVRRLSPASFAL